MSDSRAAGGIDRLPWLADEPKAPRRTRRGLSELLPWSIAVLLLIAGTSFWIGSLSQAPSLREQSAPVQSRAAPPEPLPVPQEVRIAPQPQVTPLPAPEVRPAPAREVHLAPPPVRKAQPSRSEQQTASEAAASAQASEATEARASTEPQSAASTTHSEALRPWPPRVIAGAAGRLVQVGAFGSSYQAKRGWWAMVRSYPAMEHLPALVVATRNSHGRIFFRFQIGTTSQAHSEVLCQRMQKIEFSCAVVGLPWKAKVER